jgi:hypothetical protein
MSNDNNLKFSDISKGKYRLNVNFISPNLVPGIYIPTFAIRNGITGETYERIHNISTFIIDGNTIPRGIVNVKSKWSMEKI